ncbi:hypothetical protein LBMAG53_01950 [Planctomycetota bacterium]|nr:hypothetical protein LBMAG53_01950 [Planctomycetota bacterium]
MSLAFLSACLASAVAADPVATVTAKEPLLQKYCVDCHGGSNPKAGFHLENLRADADDPDSLNSWKLIHEQLSFATMPPKTADQPDAADRAALLDLSRRAVSAGQRRAHQADGMNQARRLTREQFANSLRDLFAVPLPIGGPKIGDPARPTIRYESNQSFDTMMDNPFAKIPEDALVDGFNTTASALSLSASLLTHFENSISTILGWADERQAAHWRMTFLPLGAPGQLDAEEAGRWQDGVLYDLVSGPPGTPAMPGWRVLDTTNRPDRKRGIRPPGPEPMKGKPGKFAEKPKSDAALAAAGSGAAIKPGKRNPGPRPVWEGAFPDQVMGTALRLVADNKSDFSVSDRLVWVIGAHERPDQPDARPYGRYRMELRLKPILPADGWAGPVGRFRVAVLAGGEDSRNIYFLKDIEIVAPTTLTVEYIVGPQKSRGIIPYINVAPPALPEPSAGEDPVLATARQHRWAVDIEQIDLTGPFPIVPDSHRPPLAARSGDRTAMTDWLRPFLGRAWRRPPTTAEIDHLLDFHGRMVTSGSTPSEALNATLSLALLSPNFLYRLEGQTPGGPADRQLNDHEIGARLAFFVWSSLPDAELLGLAASGRLHDPAVLRAQVRRMLKDERAYALVNGFARQWLRLDKIESAAPDAKLYPRFSGALGISMRDETLAFCNEILRGDRSVLELLDADWTVLDKRLIDFYGIKAVGPWNDPIPPLRYSYMDRKPGPPSNETLYKVPLRREDRRGGVLTQGSVLVGNSKPNRTSPIHRGTFLLKSILGDKLPKPPADAGMIEEKSPGEVPQTLRQRLEQHRRNPTCNSCHERIDPLGFALENYDAIGLWQDRENSGSGDKLFVGGKIDPSGRLPDGRLIKDLNSLKGILLDERQRFIANLAGQMLTYALGRQPTLADEPEITAIRDQVLAADCRLSALIEGVVVSRPFLTK